MTLWLPELWAETQWKTAVLVGGRAAIRSLTGPTVTRASPRSRKCPGEEWTHWATLSLFQAWKAHLMGREGCKQNSRRTAVSQRTQPAQGKAFILPVLTPTSPTFTVRATQSAHACSQKFVSQLFHYWFPVSEHRRSHIKIVADLIWSRV